MNVIIHNCKNNNTILNTKNWVEYTEDVKKALERQSFFENQVSNISDWFVGNKDELLNSAMKVARDGFIESSVDDFIDEVDLDFIVEDIVDEIQKGILNVLSTYKDN